MRSVLKLISTSVRLRGSSSNLSSQIESEGQAIRIRLFRTTSCLISSSDMLASLTAVKSMVDVRGTAIDLPV